jgi:hypothetical protein
MWDCQNSSQAMWPFSLYFMCLFYSYKNIWFCATSSCMNEHPMWLEPYKDKLLNAV